MRVYMKMSIIILVFSICPSALCAETPAKIVHDAWSSRRVDGQENTVWNVQRYKKSDSCKSVTDISCYSKNGKERQVVQSLLFHKSGQDGAWMNFLAPKNMKKMSAVTRINSDGITGSPRHFCRGGALAKRDPRKIAQTVSEQKAVDRNVDASWLMLMMQTGVEIFHDDLFEYSLSEKRMINGAQALVISVHDTTGKLANRTLYISKNSVVRIEFLNKKGDIAWIVENKSITYSDSQWSPRETMIVDMKKGTASLMQRDESISYENWPRSYDKKSLPCGR